MPVSELPDYLLCRKGIFSLFRDPHTGKRFDDDRSIFRCVALHRKRLGFAAGLTASELSRQLSDACKGIELCARLALDDWLRSEGLAETDYDGITLSQIPSLEQLFDMDIYVYRFVPPRPPKKPFADDGEVAVSEIAGNELQRNSQCLCEYHGVGGRRHAGQALCVNVYTDANGTSHFSYISDLRLFAKVYECERCLSTFATKASLQRHAKREDCRGAVHRFPGNGAVLEPTLFESLDEVSLT